MCSTHSFYYIFALNFCGSNRICIFRHNDDIRSKIVMSCIADQSTVLLEQNCCSLTTSNRGNPILWDNLQYSYYRIQTHQAKFKSVWKCRHPGCKTRVQTDDIANVIIRCRNEHSHQINNKLSEMLVTTDDFKNCQTSNQGELLNNW